MSDTISFDGYIASVSLDLENGLLHGSVINTRDVLTFEAGDIAGLVKAFEETILDYRQWCREEGVEPERPYSGNLRLRLSPDIHRLAAVRSVQEGLSLNSWIVKTVECELGKRPATISHDELERRMSAGVREEVVRVLASRTTIGGGFPSAETLAWGVEGMMTGASRGERLQ